MLIYLLKFSACLSVFMVFYKLFLERENMHLFKRFYLLSVLLLSIGIPLITFTEYIEPQYVLDSFQAPIMKSVLPLEKEQIQETLSHYSPYILRSIYVLGVLFFGIKFIINLNSIRYKIKHNPVQKIKYFTNVLLKDLASPHTFFNYIFLNKSKFESNEIPEEIFIHEQTHATQKHSIDVLCIELLQIIFWFNPLIYLAKNSIKLNHEFLADQAVLNNGYLTSNYQNLLLEYSSYSQSNQLANAINYSSIKKRFTVMKTQTSKTTMWLRNLILLPLLALLIYSFSSTKKVEKDIFSKTIATNHTARSISVKVFNNGTYEVDDIKATKKTFVSIINQLHQDITPKIRNKIINIHVSSETDISDKEVWFIYNSVINYGFHRIVTNNQEIIREKGNKPFAITSTITQEHSKAINKKTELQKGASKKQIAEYNTLAKKYNEQPEAKRVIKLKDVKRLEFLYGLMSEAQKKNAEPFPNCPPPPAPDAPDAPKVINVKELPPPPPIPENAIPAEKKEYEKAVKNYKLKTQKVELLKIKERELINVRELRAEDQKQLQKEKLVYREAQIADRVEKIKAEKGELIRVRELQLVENRNQLQVAKLAYSEAQVAARVEKVKAEKGELVRVRELQLVENRNQLQESKLAYKEAQIEARTEKIKTEKEQLKKEKKAYKEAQRKEKATKKKSDKKENQ